MKTLIIIFFCFLTPASFGQFPSSHLDLLSKINKELTDSWTPDIDIDSSFNSVLDIPSIEVDLFNYKTEEVDGNVGVSLYLFNINDSTTVKSYDWTNDVDEDDNAFKIMETKSYIVVVDWFQDYNDIYNSLVPKLIIELTDFFKRNKNKL